MKIDAHNHFWTYSPEEFPWIDDRMDAIRRNFHPKVLKGEQRKHRICGTVAVQARQSLSETELLLGYAKQFDFVLGVVGWIDIAAPDLDKQLYQLRHSRKLRGFRHVLQDEPNNDLMLSNAFCDGLASLLEQGFSYDILIRSDQLRPMTKLLDRLPAGRLVLDHLAKPDYSTGSDWTEWSTLIKELGQNYPHIWCKLSGMVTEARDYRWEPATFDRHLDHVYTWFGHDRLMFGSDWPVCTVAGSYTDVVAIVENYTRRNAPGALDQIMGRNALSFYGIAYDRGEYPIEAEISAAAAFNSGRES